MKSHLLLLFAIISFSSSAQVWVEQNAVWHYDYWNIGTTGFYKLEYVQDTVVGGKLTQRIETTKYRFGYDQFWTLQLLNIYSAPPQFTYVNSDTVFYWNNNQFFTLFNFGANIGDQWLIGTNNPVSGFCNDSSYVEVVDTGSMNINSVNYRTITLAAVDSSSIVLQGKFVERFGFMDLSLPFQPFPRTTYCDGAIYEWDILSFKCFEDDSFPTYNPSNEDCEFLLTHLGIGDQDSPSFQLFPNPTSDFVTISSSEPGNLQIFDCFGKQVQSHTFITTETIDLSKLENGMYVFVFLGDSGSIRREHVQKID